MVTPIKIDKASTLGWLVTVSNENLQGLLTIRP